MSMRFRIPRVVVALLAAAVLALPLTHVAFGAGAVTHAWRAKVGASGVNGTANVSTVTTGAGSIGLKLVKLRASSALPVAVHSGTCATVGAVLFRLAPITTTSIGSASRTNVLTAAQVKLILAASTGTGKVAIRVGSGPSATCGAFAKRVASGPQAVVQSFYDWYLTPHSFAATLARPELTAGFVQWLKTHRASFPADPIVCAQEYPAWVTAGPAAIPGLSATVHITDSFSTPASVPVKLTLGPTGWQISAVGCGF